MNTHYGFRRQVTYLRGGRGIVLPSEPKVTENRKKTSLFISIIAARWFKCIKLYEDTDKLRPEAIAIWMQLK